MIAVDSNFLVYAHREDSPFHDAACARIVELAEGNAPWAIPWPCIHEFLAIVTHPRIYAPPTPLEKAIDHAGAVCSAITSWENRWAQRNLVEESPDRVSQRAKNTLAKAEAMSPEDYRAALLERETAQMCHAKLAPLADAVITLSCPGPAPLWFEDIPGQPLAPFPTGNAIFNYPSSMLFAPAVTMPLLSVNGMPVGVQLMGQQHSDARITAMARWMLETISPVVIN